VPQKPHIVRLLQLLDRARIVLELLVVQPDRPHILVPPVHRLHLALPPQRLRHLGRGHAQRQQNKKYRDDQTHQHEALLLMPFHFHSALKG
jgi:hypothetical protein